MTQIAFDDLDALRAACGEEWSGWGPEFHMTQDKINGFAELTGDHQWIHVDVERANAGPFGGPIAHGFFTLSLVASINRSDQVQITGYRNAVNYGADGLRFLAPVPAGSTVRARSRLKEVREHKKGTLVATQVAIHVEGNEVPSVLYDALTLFQG
jgi:hypothetical protein